MVGETNVSTVVAVDMKRRMKRQMRDYQLNTVGVSNATNSKSPNDLRSRIFIGNLNTSVVNKRHLHVLFQQYGEIKAISMHKGKVVWFKWPLNLGDLNLGYAFIQYSDEMDALNSVFAQDGQLVAGQAIGKH